MVALRPRYCRAIPALPMMLVVVGCAPVKETGQAVYVSVERLAARHPALGARDDREYWPASQARGIAIAAMPGLPEPLGPGAPVRQPDSGDRGREDLAQKRLDNLQRGLAARASAARLREAKLAQAALRAERREIMREAEDRIAQAQRAAASNARPAMRDLDLRIVALTAQRGSPAAGPPEDVERALADARARRKAFDVKLANELAAIRNRETTAVRERFEAREADVERSLEIADAERRREADATMRRYREALESVAQDLPNRTEPAAEPGPPAIATSLVARRAQAPSLGAQVRAQHVRPVHRTDSERALRDLAIADVRRHTVRIGRERGWRVFFERRAGCPDMTEQVAEILTKERFLR